jgi:hypothetical protein
MRKTKVVIVELEGRDRGKMFLLTEMSARRAEEWGTRAFLALARSGVDIPDYAEGSGMASLAAIGLRALGRIAFDEARPLMDEMMRCIKIVPDPSKPAFIRDLLDDGGDGDDIEEVMTRAWLKSEVFELHTGFSIAAAISNRAVAS